MKILVLGATGMLGSSVFRAFTADREYETWGTIRSSVALKYFPKSVHERLFFGINVLDQDALVGLMAKLKPDVVINCVGLIKQLADAKNPLTVLPINAMLPHHLASLCKLGGARLIHVSTDCVFSGRKGLYLESDLSDAEDIYGKSKFMGELHDFSHAITLRTSIIGHELESSYALIDWFIAQQSGVKGYTKAVFSGLPTVELARVIKDFVLPNRELSGLFHVAAEPIDKYRLLCLVAAQYGKNIEICPNDELVIDRSLDGTRFREATGYVAQAWPELIKSMYDNRWVPEK